MVKSIKILYVDDESINLMLFNSMFGDKYQILTAESGDEALELLSDNLVDVVVSDMKMPGMDGLEFIVRAKELYPDIIFYILTGFEVIDKIKDALSKKLIDKYFQKPFNMLDIEKAILTRLGF